jgi:hypothetical protein
MIIGLDDTIDFDIMHGPPTFVTTVRADDGTTVVVTSGNDFPGIVVQWPEQLPDERSEDFWALGLLHLAEVELVKLPPDARDEAILSVNVLERHDPRGLGSKVAAIVRDVTAAHPGIAKTMFALSKDEMAQYRKLLIIRATAPYVGSDDVKVVNIGGGVIAA